MEVNSAWVMGAFGIIITAFLSMMNSTLNRFLRENENLAKRHSDHVENAQVHDAGLARLEGKINHLLELAEKR